MTAADRHALWQQLIQHEGIRLKVYIDSVGVPTIGVGRNLKDKGITQTEAMLLLEHDVDEVLEDLATFPWFAGLDPIRQRVMADFRFNLGGAGMRKFKNTLAAVARGDYETAAQGMAKSLWARQVKGRATRLIAMMRTGADV